MDREKLRQLIFGVLGVVLGAILGQKYDFQPPVKEKCPPDAQPSPRPDDKPPTMNPIQSIGQIQFGKAGCTATLIHPVRADGQYDVLTADHCISGQPQEGVMRLTDGRSFRVRVAARCPKCDAAWLVTLDAPAGLPLARLASALPSRGAAVRHAGFGIDKPGNVESGTFAAGDDSSGQCEYWLSVSSGDSGGAIWDVATGAVLSPVCCTTRLAAPGRVWGASPASCARIRPGQ
jgi:hypothetical protein